MADDKNTAADTSAPAKKTAARKATAVKSDARYTAQVTALVDQPTKDRIARIADLASEASGSKVSAGAVLRHGLTRGLDVTEREAQRGRLRDE